MGQIILPQGGSITIDGSYGTVELNSLVRELKDSDLTDSYRIAVIGCLGRIGKPANSAVVDLKKIKDTGNRILKEAATQAIDKIESDNTSQVVVPTTSTSVSPPSIIPDHTNFGRHNGNNQTSSHRGYSKEKYKIDFLPIKKSSEIFENCPVINECMFCGKIFEFQKSYASINRALTGKDNYCYSCMRNKYYLPENVKNLVSITYRSLIGYIYYSFVARTQIYIGDIKEMISDHVVAGMSNPLFSYDPEIYTWFVDMSPVIEKKVDISQISSTIACQLSALGIAEIFYRGNPHIIYKKIIDSLLNGEKSIMPMPTDGGCCIEDRGIPKDYLIEFIPSHLADSTVTNRRKWEK